MATLHHPNFSKQQKYLNNTKTDCIVSRILSSYQNSGNISNRQFSALIPCTWIRNVVGYRTLSVNLNGWCPRTDLFYDRCYLNFCSDSWLLISTVTAIIPDGRSKLHSWTPSALTLFFKNKIKLAVNFLLSLVFNYFYAVFLVQQKHYWRKQK